MNEDKNRKPTPGNLTGNSPKQFVNSTAPKMSGHQSGVGTRKESTKND